MTNSRPRMALAMLTLIAALGAAAPAVAQVAGGTTTADTSVTESTQKVGRLDDLIVAPYSSVSRPVAGMGRQRTVVPLDSTAHGPSLVEI